ncbi:unnamed protein product [Pleuronectes platessa]|uniref:Uncharacterized protein n=1 Tax=Pleuronectes platessa TaxID=8262 RepID=A0A9N7V4V4_PLEPL|nr:unnamed protein product [Pleuronectes platessa]
MTIFAGPERRRVEAAGGQEVSRAERWPFSPDMSDQQTVFGLASLWHLVDESCSSVSPIRQQVRAPVTAALQEEAHQISLTDVSDVDRYNFSLATQPGFDAACFCLPNGSGGGAQASPAGLAGCHECSRNPTKSMQTQSCFLC